jgi:heme-degrading monooxygenase HmoA
MIARTWRGRATREKADDYLHHFETDVVGNLKGIPGNKGAYLLRRAVDGEVEFLAVTFWDSIETIKKFSGEDPEAAHIEPEGRAALREFDDFARNYEIVCAAGDRAQEGQDTP